MTSISGHFVPPVIEAYDFGESGTLADIGGGHGILLSMILQKHRALRGIVFDLPHVVEGAKPRIKSLGLASGCEIIGSYAPSLPIYALAFGSDYSGGVHWNALQKLYPGVIHYDPFGRQFLSFAFDQKIDDVKQMVKSGKCVLIESDPLDESTFNVFRLRDGIEIETLTIVANPFPPSEPTALYRLRPAGAAKVDP